MASFPGGSAYAFARDIGEGYQTVTDRTFKGFSRAEIDQLAFEIDRALREIRADNNPNAEIPEVQARQRKIQRLNSALMIARSARQKIGR